MGTVFCCYDWGPWSAGCKCGRLSQIIWAELMQSARGHPGRAAASLKKKFCLWTTAAAGAREPARALADSLPEDSDVPGQPAVPYKLLTCISHWFCLPAWTSMDIVPYQRGGSLIISQWVVWCETWFLTQQSVPMLLVIKDPCYVRNAWLLLTFQLHPCHTLHCCTISFFSSWGFLQNGKFHLTVFLV